MKHHVLALLLATGAFAGSTALVNGNFEADLTGWTVWGGATTTVAHGGAKAVKVTNTKATWSGVDQVIEIPAGKTKLKVSGWLKADSIQQGKEKWELGRIALEFRDAKTDLAGGYPPVVGEVVGTTDWAKVERTYDLPKTATTIKLQCALGNTTGTVFCDDLTVEFLK